MKQDFLKNIRPEVRIHFQKYDPIMHGLVEKIAQSDADMGAWRVKSVAPQQYFYYLAREIVYQQLSGAAAGTIFGRLEELLGAGVAENAGENSITATAILAQDHESLRSVGLSRAKATYLHALAKAVEVELLDFERFTKLSDQAIIEQLTRVKGIGQWTAEMFLMFAMGREDVFSTGDLGLRKAVQRWYGFPVLPKPGELKQLSEKWSPYRTYASCILWASLE